jgi:predicted MFS family arabinose efflux permease
MSEPGALPRLRADPVFRRFWFAHAITVTGSWVTFIALPLLVYQRTGSAFQTALLTALEVVPYLVFGLVAGAVADRVDRRKLMVRADLGSAAALATIPIASAFGVLTVAQIYVVALTAMSLFVWYDAANFGAVPALVGKGRIVEAQSALWSATMFLGVVGPALGGALAAGLGAANAIALDAVSFAACACVLLTIRRPFQLHRDETAPAGAVRRTLRDIRDGLAFLWGHALVRTLTLLGLGVSFTGGAVSGLLVVFAARALGVSTRGEAIGVLFAAGALGALLATLVLPRVQRRFGAARVTLVVLSVDVVLLVALAHAPGYPAALGLYFAWSAAQMLVIVNGIALRQTVTPDRLQSRVNATARMIALGGTPFGALVGGVLAEALPVRTAILIGGLGVATSAVLAWFSPLRERHVQAVGAGSHTGGAP